MGKAPDMCHILNGMIAAVPISLQEAVKVLQKSLWMLSRAIGLIFVQNDWMLRVAACTVQPHIALGFCCLPRLSKHLQLRFIGVNDIMLYQLLMQHLVHRFNQSAEQRSSQFDIVWRDSNKPLFFHSCS